MRLSVVIPCDAQEGEPLERTLATLQAQQEPPQEILLVANPDGTEDLEAVASASPGLIRVVRPQRMVPVVDLWNFGIASATGDWISLLTSQVTVRPGFCRAFRESAERSTTATVLRAGWTRERPAGGPSEQHTLLSVRTITHAAEALYEQRFGPKASSAAAAIRRDAWERMGGLSPEISLLGDWIGDWALWLAAGALGDTVRSPEVIADIHVRGPRSTKAEEVCEMFQIYERILPRAAQAARLPDPTWIAAASRKRFRDVAIAASNEIPAGSSEERSRIALALEPWAQAVEQEPLLKRLREGEKIRSFTLGKKVKPAFRRVIAAVR